LDDNLQKNKAFDFEDENNFASYVPSQKDNSGKNSMVGAQGGAFGAPQGASRRGEYQRQPTAELAKSEYPPLPSGQLADRPPSRRATAITPTRRPDTSMPPTYDTKMMSQQDDFFQKAAKTDQNFFRPKVDDLFSGEVNDGNKSGNNRPSRQSNPKASISGRGDNDYHAGGRSFNTGQGNNASAGFGNQAPRRTAHEDDFFVDPDDHTHNKQGDGLGGQHGEYSLLQGGGKSIRPGFENYPEIELLATNLDKAEKRIEKLTQDNQKLQMELTKIQLENKTLSMRKEEAERFKKDQETRFAQELQAKEKHFDEMRRLIEVKAQEALEALEKRHNEDILYYKKQIDDNERKMRAMLEKDTSAGMQNMNQTLKKIQDAMSDKKLAADSQMLQEKLDRLAQSMKELQEQKSSLDVERKRNEEYLQEEKKSIRTLFVKYEDAAKDLSRKKEEVDKRYRDFDREVDAKTSLLKEKEQELFDRERKIERIEKEAEHKLIEADEQSKHLMSKVKNDRRDLDQRMKSLADKEFEAQQRMKMAIERDADSRTHTEIVENKMRTLKLREETLERESQQLQEAKRLIEKEKAEIQMFRDNYDAMKLQNISEQRRLNVFASKLNEELEKLNREKINVDLMKKTLSSLRTDYTQEMRNKLDRDNFIRQDIALYRVDPNDRSPEYHPTNTVEFMPKADHAKPEDNSRLEMLKLEERAGKRFDFDGYMNRLKYNY
jgi:hypothetical protein